MASPDHPIRHSLAGVQLKFSVRDSHFTFPASGDVSWWIAKLPDRSLKDLSLWRSASTARPFPVAYVLTISGDSLNMPIAIRNRRLRWFGRR
jgi:serine/threonine-protein kinase HipA